MNEAGIAHHSASVIWRYAKVLVLVSVGVLLTVGPFCLAITTERHHTSVGLGIGLSLGLGIGLRLGSRSGVSIGIGAGSLVGIIAALIEGFAPFNGIGIIIPPIIGIAIGFVDGIGTERLRGFREAIVVSLVMGAVLGAGLWLRYGWQGFAGALVMSLFVGTMAGMRSDSDGGMFRRFRRPPILVIVPCAGLFALVTWAIAAEGHGWASPFVALISLIVLPGAGFAIMRAVAAWLRPRLTIYRQLTGYLNVMWVPIGAFALGYAAIILVWAGFFGALHQTYPAESFTGIDPAIPPSMNDWLFFSFFNATAQDYNQLQPASNLARLLVGSQLIVNVGWAVVVFAAVMSLVQPQMKKLAETQANGQDAE